MNLRFDVSDAMDAGETRRPADVMRALGITYDRLEPQSMFDQCWFWDCKGVPEELPSYISELKRG